MYLLEKNNLLGSSGEINYFDSDDILAKDRDENSSFVKEMTNIAKLSTINKHP
jgi:hypothetical protein